MPVKKYDVYLADVPFEDLPDSKVRPVLILDDKVYLVECLKMTSTSRPEDYTLKQWKYVGLNHETTVRLNKHLSLRKTRLIKRIGSSGSGGYHRNSETVAGQVNSALYSRCNNAEKNRNFDTKYRITVLLLFHPYR